MKYRTICKTCGATIKHGVCLKYRCQTTDNSILSETHTNRNLAKTAHNKHKRGRVF